MASMARYFGRMVIGAVVPMDWSTRRIINYLAGTVGTYRRTDMLKDIREAKDIYTYGSKVKDLAINIRPPTDIMVETKLKRARRYRVFASARHVNKETGRVSYHNISFYDDSLRTKEQWEDEYIDQKEKDEYEVGETVTDVDIFAIEHHEGWGY